jgi:hypothetical protein
MSFVRIFEAAGKKKKTLRREQKPKLSVKGRHMHFVAPSSPRAKSVALGEGALFAESEIPGSQLRSLLRREPGPRLSAKGASSPRVISLALGEGVVPTRNGGTVS